MHRRTPAPARRAADFTAVSADPRRHRRGILLCPRCRAGAAEECVGEDGRATRTIHPERLEQARRADVADVLAEFRAALEARGVRPSTTATYTRCVARLAGTGVLAGSKNTAALVTALGKLAPATRELYMNAARAFDRWRAERDGHARKFADVVRIRRDIKAPIVLTPEEAVSLEKAARDRATSRGFNRFGRWRSDVVQLRELVWFYVLRYTGCRPKEALALRWHDVELAGGREAITFRETKGRTDRVVPLDSKSLALRDALRRYKKAITFNRRYDRDAAPGDAAFVLFGGTGFGWPWSYRAALVAWGAICAQASITATPYILRRTRATELLREGVPERIVQRLFGWRDFNVAKRYVDVTAGDVRAALEARRP